MACRFGENAVTLDSRLAPPEIDTQDVTAETGVRVETMEIQNMVVR